MRHSTQCPLLVLFTPHPEHWMTFSASRADADNAPPTGDRRRKPDIWTTRWGRHKSGVSRGCQPKEPLERPANTTKGTKYQTQKPSGSTQTRPKRTCFCNVRRPSIRVVPSSTLDKNTSKRNTAEIETRTNLLRQRGTTVTLDEAPLQSPRLFIHVVEKTTVSRHGIIRGQQNETSAARSVADPSAPPTA